LAIGRAGNCSAVALLFLPLEKAFLDYREQAAMHGGIDKSAGLPVTSNRMTAAGELQPGLQPDPQSEFQAGLQSGVNPAPHAVFGLSPIPMWRTRAVEGKRIEAVNTSWLAYTGRSQEQERDHGWRDCVHPDDLDCCISAYNEACKSHTAYSCEYRLRRHDGHYRWMLEQAGPEFALVDTSEVNFIGCCIDITTQKDRENLLLARNATLTEEARQKDEFLAMLSHELRNPLAAIASSLAVMRNYHISDPLIAKNRSIIERQFESLSGVVNDLLDVARIANGKIGMVREAITLDDVIERALEISRPRIEAMSHTLKLSRPPETIPIHGDVNRLGQALANLLNNAAKFTPQSGTITLSAGRDSERTFLKVQDAGVGINPAFRPRLFQLFAQDDSAEARTQGGLGIGLAVAREIVSLHGGTIEAVSDGPGRGSEFTIYLPTDAPHEQVEVKPAVAGAGVLENRQFRILLIDDNEDANESMGSLLKLLNYDVRTANDAESGLKAAVEFQPHLILSDIGLPGTDGYQLAPALRKAAGDRKLILAAATGYGLASDRSRSQAAGFDYHLVKPLDADSLLDFIAQQAAAY
jgi:PAS domain S-box-containing protein